MKTVRLKICAPVALAAMLFTACVSQKDSVTSTPSLSPTSMNAPSGPQPQASPPPASSGKPLKLPLASPKIVVLKSQRQLMLYSGRKLLRAYRVGLGFNPISDKVKEGDGATPEGEFYIFTKNENSNYYLSLGLSYPNLEDARRGLRDGLITEAQYQQIATAIRRKDAPPQDTPLGGQIYIHGRGSHKNWTWGCVALDDKDIRELFDAVSVGTKVIIEH